MSQHARDPEDRPAWMTEAESTGNASASELFAPDRAPSTEVVAYSASRREISTKVDRALMSLRLIEDAQVEPAHVLTILRLYDQAIELLHELKDTLESSPLA